MNYYKSGDWNTTCDVCSKKMKASHARKRWDGFLVCNADFEERHPQDFVRARQDKITVEETRPIPTLTYTSVPYITQYFYTGYIEDNYIADSII